jgi:hypothetical protein
MSEHTGLLGALTETLEIQQTVGCNWEEALQAQRQAVAHRLREHELATAESNIIPFPTRRR